MSAMGDVSPNNLLNLASAVKSHNENWRRPARVMDAGPGLRLIAAIVDLVFFSLNAIVFGAVITLMCMNFGSGQLAETRAIWVLNIAVLSGACVYLGCEAAFGFTVGKACLGLRAVASGVGIFKRALLMRWTLRCLPLFAAALLCGVRLGFLFLQTDAGFAASFWGDFIVPLFLPPATLVLMYIMARTPCGIDQQSWYDHIAGTRVVRRPSGRVIRGFEPIIRDER
jgi:hypothetical protein